MDGKYYSTAHTHARVSPVQYCSTTVSYCVVSITMDSTIHRVL